MNISIKASICSLLLATVAAASPVKAVAAGEEIFLADPTIFTEGSKYYLTGTRFVDPQGFPLLESDDLVNWTYVRPDMMILRNGGDSYGTTGFWAPQILKYGDDYVLAYTANEQCVMALSPTVDGIYSQTVKAPIDGSQKNIDPFIFRDDDGKYYLYHVRFGGGNYIWGAEFNPETGKIVDGTLTKCFSNTQQWENTGSYPSDPIMEGPTVIKLDGKYYLFYSANHFQSIDYAVGYAVADSPLGPWTKNENNPMISRAIVGEKGSGHGDIFFDRDENMRYVYHVHCNDNQANPRRTRIVKLDVDKSGGHPYRITANKESIIVPVMEPHCIDNADVTSVEFRGSVVGSPALLSDKGNGIWSGEVNLNGSSGGEYLNRTVNFRLNGDDALTMKRVPGTNTLRLLSECYNGGENIRINPGTYTVTVNLNDGTYSFDAEVSPYRISVFGSSVANGQGATSRQGYAYQYGKLLESRYSKGTSNNPFVVSGVSIGGNTTTALLNRYDDLLRDFGKYVIIGLSMGNEGIHEAPDKERVFNQFRDNMLTLIEKSRADGKTPIVMNNYTRGDYTAADYSYICRMNTLIHEWDVPSFNTLGAIDNGEGKWADGYIADNGHPNTEGHAEFMYAMVPSLFDALNNGKPLPERDMTQSLEMDRNTTVTFKGEERVHPFTVSIRVKGARKGQVLSFKHGNRSNYTGRIIVEPDGKITYDSPAETDFTSRRALLNDDEWHTITLTHFYARGETLLYVDNVYAGSTKEKLLPGQFTIGNPSAADDEKFTLSELFFWRAGMNATEIKAHNEGKMLKSSLEIYSPMTRDASTANDADTPSFFLINKAQSTNAPVCTSYKDSAITMVETDNDSSPLEYYGLNGISVTRADSLKGVYIVKYSDGKVRKEKF